MKINIQAPLALESKVLLLNVKRKINAFTKMHKAIQEVDVKLKEDIVSGQKISEIYLKKADKNIYAIQPGRTFELATDKTLIKLQKQLDISSEPVETANAPEDASPETE